MHPRQLLVPVLLLNLIAGGALCALIFWKPGVESKNGVPLIRSGISKQDYWVSQDTDRTSVKSLSPESIDSSTAWTLSERSTSPSGAAAPQAVENSKENIPTKTATRQETALKTANAPFNNPFAAEIAQKPLAFMIDLNRSSLTAEDRTKVDALKTQFNNTVNGAYAPDLSNPQSVRKWRNAMSESDELFRAYFGWAAYADLVNARARQAGGFQ